MSLEVQPAAVTPVDRSITLNGGVQTLVAANRYRTHLQFQCPGANITYSYTNSSPNDPAGTLLTGCYILSAGSTWVQATCCPGTAIYVNGGTAGNGKLLICTEC